MKRSASTIATPPTTRSSLQQPISCQLCRARKLKCSRELPCFNCSSRNVACIYASGSQSRPYPPRTAVPASNDGQQHVNQRGERGYASLAHRIRRLEAAVFPDDAPEATDFESPCRPALVGEIEDGKPQRNKDEEQQRTSRWLEALLTYPNPSDAQIPRPAETTSVRFQTEETHQANLLSGAVDISTILSQFPTQSTAEAMLEHYIKTFNAIYPILHVPTTRCWLRELYVDLHACCIPSATRLAFFLSIFASSAYLSKDQLQPEPATLGGRSLAAAPSELWFGHAVSLLTRPPVPPSTQALQAYTGLAYLCSQLEGLTESFGILTIFTLQMSRSMKIHLLDSPRCREERQKNGADMVDVEVKRRLWWHLASSDWLMANMTGPLEGTYMLHPRQMETKYPSNVEDETIPTGITHLSEETYNLPLSMPTSITYFLFRIQAAALCREVIDRLPPSYFFSPPAVDSNDETYNTILLLDQHYQQFLQSLPPFFQLKPRRYSNHGYDSDNSYEKLIQERPYLEWQRPLLNFVIHTHIARLHRPFLIRGSTEPKFAYSRMQCIRSAETVLEVRNSITLGAQTTTDVVSFLYMLQHFLMAAIVLAMDVCFNQGEMHVAQRKQDVLRACRVLEEELRANLDVARQNGPSSRKKALAQSLQRVVHNLREVLKRRVDKDRAATTTNDVEVVDDNDDNNNHKRVTSTDKMAIEPESEPDGSAVNVRERRMVQKQQRQHLEGDGAPLPAPLPLLPPSLPLPYEHNQPQQDGQPKLQYQTQDEVQDRSPTGEREPTLNELWDEFFSVGPTFDGSDWDMFLVDLDSQMGLGGQ